MVGGRLRQLFVFNLRFAIAAAIGGSIVLGIGMEDPVANIRAQPWNTLMLLVLNVGILYVTAIFAALVTRGNRAGR
jgi:hypothetical protein